MRALIAALGRAAGTLLAQACLVCRAPSGNAPACEGCRADLPRFGAVCPCCALPSPGGQHCGACLAAAPDFDTTLAAWRYTAHAAALVHAYKYGGRLPLAGSRLAERGLNQSLEIARPLAGRLRVPLAARAVRRIRETAGAFAVDADVRGARVAVLDDVMTTGATLDELACALTRAGAASVATWVVARTVRDD